MIEFGEKQRKMIAFGLTALALAFSFAFVAAVVWGLLKALAFVSAAIVPVALGFFLSLFFKPYYLWWRRVVRNPTLALTAMLLTVVVPVSLVIWSTGSMLVAQVVGLFQRGPELVQQVLVWFRANFGNLIALLDHFGVPYDEIGRMYTDFGGVAKNAGMGAIRGVSLVGTLLLSLVFFVYFLTSRERRGSDIVAELPFLGDETKAFWARQIDTFVEILVSFFQRQVIICIIEGCYYGCGFSLVGLPYGFLIGFLLGMLNLVPFFGTLVCLPVALPLAYFVNDGSAARLVMVLTVWLVGQFLDGYVITPHIQGNKTGLGYAGVIFSFVFWACVLGPMLGLLLAIPLSAFCVVLWRAVKARYSTLLS